MKKLLIPLLPIATISAIAMPLIACGPKKQTGLQTIPDSRLNIRVDEGNKHLEGLKEPTKDVPNVGTNLKLVVPGDIYQVQDFNYTDGGAGDPETKAYKHIRVIEFATRESAAMPLNIPDSAFSSLPELTTIIFPSDCSKVVVESTSFTSCQKINVIDFSKTVNFSSSLKTIGWLSTCASEGTFYCNEDNKSTVEGIRSTFGLSSINWPVVVK